MSVPPDPNRWAIREEDGSGRLVIIARNHDADHWRDVAEMVPGSFLAELIVETMNARGR